MSACPICKTPVTFGGGIIIQKVLGVCAGLCVDLRVYLCIDLSARWVWVFGLCA